MPALCQTLSFRDIVHMCTCAGPQPEKKVSRLNYYSNPSNMVEESEKERARLAKEAAERDRREKRLEARAFGNSLSDGLAGAAAAATAAAAMGGSKSGRGSRVSSPPPRSERDKSPEAESPVANKARRSGGGRRVSPGKSSAENSEAEGSDQSVPASASEDEHITAGAKIAATKRLMGKTKIALTPPAKDKASKAKERAANDKSASASQVYHHDASVDFTI